MKKLVIIGNTGNAKLAHYYFENDSEFQVVAFSVNKQYITSSSYCNLNVIPLEELATLYPPDDYHAFVAIGYTNMNTVRENLYKHVKKLGYKLPNYISSKCTFLTTNKIGDNNLILENNTIQPFVKIGNNNVLWSGNHIGHDVEIYDNCFITSHAVISGFTIIKNNCFIGVNATLRDAITIDKFTLIGAGATIMRTTKPESVHLAPKSIAIDKKSTDLKIS